MKNLKKYLGEEFNETPGNTVGMGNPAPPTTTDFGTEPISCNKTNCKKQKRKKNKHNMKTLYESILDDEEDLVNDNSALIEKFLKENYKISGNYNIHDNIVDVEGDLTLKNSKITTITNDLFKFGKITGGFLIYRSDIVSLEGMPMVVNEINVSNCKNLQSLKGCPMEVNEFCCITCPELKSLVGGPTNVNIYQVVNCDKLKNLKGAPTKVGELFNCSRCDGLTSLKGCPVEIEGDFCCEDCLKLQTLKDGPKIVKGAYEYGGTPVANSTSKIKREREREYVKATGCSQMKSYTDDDFMI